MREDAGRLGTMTLLLDEDIGCGLYICGLAIGDETGMGGLFAVVIRLVISTVCPEDRVTRFALPLGTPMVPGKLIVPAGLELHICILGGPAFIVCMFGIPWGCCGTVWPDGMNIEPGGRTVLLFWPLIELLK